SMCAMMPMLRTFVRSVRTSCATVSLSAWSCSSSCAEGAGVGGARRPDGRARHTLSPARSPAVVREGLVGLGHLVRVLAALDRGAEAVAGVEDLVHQALGHRLLATLPGVADQPAQGQRGAAARLDLDRHLVGGATDTAGLDLQGRLDV